MENNKMDEEVFKSYDDLPLFLSVKQITSLLNISRGKIYELVQEEGLPAIRFGKKYVFPKEKLMKWLDSRTEE